MVRPAVLSLILLAGCSHKPSVEQTLAQCQLDAARENHTLDPTALSNDSYVETCMRASGYTLDPHKCTRDFFVPMYPRCYSRK